MSFLRPDEKASQAEIERQKKFDERLKKGASVAASVALPIAGAALTSRILPLLSEHIPLEMALKGISKISPKIGNFLKKGTSMGLNLKEGLQYVKDVIQPEDRQESIQRQEQQTNQNEPMQPYAGGHNEPFQGEGALNTIDHNQQQSQPEQSQEQKQRSVIEQYSPELYQFMLQQIVSGRDPIQAGAIAQNDKRFSPIIQKMQKDSNMSWSQIIQKIFGTGAQASYQQMNQQQPQQAQQMQQQAQGQPQGQQAPGQGQQALMAILQEIRSARGK